MPDPRNDKIKSLSNYLVLPLGIISVSLLALTGIIKNKWEKSFPQPKTGPVSETQNAAEVSATEHNSDTSSTKQDLDAFGVTKNKGAKPRVQAIVEKRENSKEHNGR